MRGLGDLVDSLDDEDLAGKVTRLAIVAHGDQPGTVVLDRELNHSNVGRFAGDLRRLSRFLTHDAMLVFYSCIAGRGPEGTQLFLALSGHLPGRTIVGFELYGLIGASGMPNRPGSMEATDTSLAQLAIQPGASLGQLDPWCRFAKWAKDGRITRIPILEQNGRAGRRCANPSCPGHDQAGHRCPGW